MRPKWVNPCGGVLDEASADSAATGPPLGDAEVAASAVLDIDLALHHMQLFKNEFVSASFKNLSHTPKV